MGQSGLIAREGLLRDCAGRAHAVYSKDTAIRLSGTQVSSKDKKARRAALRHFLVETPGALDRATDSLGWLVVLGALALGALVLHLLFGHPDHPPLPPPGGPGDNPSAALYVRDLGRLPDGRHSFDLVYTLVLRNAAGRPASVAAVSEQVSVGDPAPTGDIVDLGHRPPGAWHVVAGHRDTARGPDLAPGQWRVLRAHYRLTARPEQFAAVAIGYRLEQARRGWFDHGDGDREDRHEEEAQLGAVVRVHCAPGVKIQNGDMTSLCGS